MTELRWRGIEVSENGARELRTLYDIAYYAKALRDQNSAEPGVPMEVHPIIRGEFRILLGNLEPYDTCG